MNIKLINHASLLISGENFKLLTDPWYSGSIFNNGWKLLHEDENQKISNYDFDFLWISHEHPDHFSVNDIKKIDENKKKNFKILYQKTKDKKVVNFLKKLNFQVLEVEDLKTISLKPNVKFTISSVGSFDSWSVLELDDKIILNLNDCNITESELKKIKKRWKSIDVLVTQFSFASWICNPKDDDTAKKQVQRVKNRVDNQIKILNPKNLIPFASFFYFCHQENNYLNKYIIDIESFYESFKSKVNIVILFPNDTYYLDKTHNNLNAIKKWQMEYKKIPEKKLIYTSKKYDINDIIETHNQYKYQLSKKNNLLLIRVLSLLGILKSTKVYLNDLNVLLNFNLINDLKVLKNINKPDITMSSESFIYLLKYNWGRGTLFINGRLSCNYKKLNNFMALTKIFYANNIGLYFPGSLKLRDLFKKNNFSNLIEEFCE